MGFRGGICFVGFVGFSRRQTPGVEVTCLGLGWGVSSGRGVEWLRFLLGCWWFGGLGCFGATGTG